MSIIYISVPWWLDIHPILDEIVEEYPHITLWIDERITERKYVDILTYPQELLLFCGLQREKWYYTHASKDGWYVSPSGFLDYLAFHGYNPNIVQDFDLEKKSTYYIFRPPPQEWYISQSCIDLLQYWKYYEPYFPGIHHPRMSDYQEKQLQFLHKKDVNTYQRLLEMIRFVQWDVCIHDSMVSQVSWQMWIKNNIHTLLTN